MPTARDWVFGPWRAVPVLGTTPILAWGAIFYPPVLTVPLIAAERTAAAAAARLALHSGGGVRRLCIRAVRALGAPARDLRPRRDRFDGCGHDWDPIRPVPGVRPHRRVHVRAPAPTRC